jgi:hypothetical protein
MARPLPIACATLLSVLTLGSLGLAEDKKDPPKKEEAKKDEPKKEEATKEEPAAEPPVSTDSSKAEKVTDTPKPAVTDDENKYDWRKEPGGEHGSQVASSEWLPISIGAAAGVMIGALAGSAADDSKPPVVGPILGGVAGGFAGGAGGAWLIRAQREKDTRLAGTITGLSVGVGVGGLLFAKMDADGRALETIGKWGSLVIAPLVGAVAGRAIASYFYLKPPKEAPAAPTAIVPSVSPVVTGSHGATGMTFGIDAVF